MSSAGNDSVLEARERAIRDQVTAERRLALGAVPEEEDQSAFAFQMKVAINSYWDKIQNERLEQCRAEHAQQADEDARVREAQQQAERVRREEEERQFAAVQTAAKMKELLGTTSPSTSIDKDKGKKVIEMAEGRRISASVNMSRPGESILKKIEQGEYSIPLWHLTREGTDHAQRARERGKSKVAIKDGEFAMEEDTSAKLTDEELSEAAWIGASNALIHWAQQLGRPKAEVEGLSILHETLTAHALYPHFPRAFHTWHRVHRQTWCTSHLGSPDGKRDDLRLIRMDWWNELRLNDEVRQWTEAANKKVDETIQASLLQHMGPRKRSTPDDETAGGSSSGPSSSHRTSFRAAGASPPRCLICGVREPRHPFATCNATTRVDNRQQIIQRTSEGRITFKDDNTEPCTSYNTGRCNFKVCKRVHRCTNCGTRGHGDASCPQL